MVTNSRPENEGGFAFGPLANCRELPGSYAAIPGSGVLTTCLKRDTIVTESWGHPMRQDIAFDDAVRGYE